VVATTADFGRVTLLDGSAVRYRPIRPSDRVALQRFHDRLSDRSVYQRFFGPKPHLGDDQARYFTELDGIDRVALVALDPAEPGELIGVVRFDREPGTARAEYAAVVADRWQGRGLGLGLTRCLVEAARGRGIRSLYALVLPDNRRMLNLLRDLGLPERVRHEAGVELVEVRLFDEGKSTRSPAG
jgi:RimJ/RimL family protein N-acetyltransferase